MLKNKKSFTSFFLMITLISTSIAYIGGCGNSGQVQQVDKPGGLTLGDKAADFSLMDENGHLFKSSEVQPGWFLILIFYRGYWCGDCKNQLWNLKQDYSKFMTARVAVAAISTDSIEDSADFNQNWRFPFPLLSDPNLHLIDAYGLRHPHGHGIHDISHPSMIIIDPQKTIQFKYVGKNPQDRLQDDEILYVIQQIRNRLAKTTNQK